MWKPFKIIREHWKKSVFFSSLSLYGVHLIDQRIKVNNLMRQYCLEAASYGNQPWNPKRPLRHLTIILNPVANKRKGKQLFHDYAKQILNCAGIKLSVIETESEGQAKDYMGIMDNTDGVIIVGGDGTVHEAVTGYLRREDSNTKRPLPFGFLPVGKRNSGMFKLFHVDVDSNGRIANKAELINLIGRLSMAIIKETVKPVDVIKIEGKERGKPVYALHSFDFGRLHDYLEKAENYWIFSTKLKPYYPLYKNIFFQNLSSQKLPVDVDIFYTKPCPGCSACYESFKEPNKAEPPKRWWHRLIPRPSQLKSNYGLKDKYESLKNVNNQDCGVWYKVDASDLINFSMRNSFDKKLDLYVHSIENADKTSLINDGVSLFRDKSPSSQAVQKLEARDISITIHGQQQDEQQQDDQQQSQQLEDAPSPLFDIQFSIDRNNYESQNVLMTLLPNRIMVYS